MGVDSMYENLDSWQLSTIHSRNNYWTCIEDLCHCLSEGNFVSPLHWIVGTATTTIEHLGFHFLQLIPYATQTPTSEALHVEATHNPRVTVFVLRFYKALSSNDLHFSVNLDFPSNIMFIMYKLRHKSNRAPFCPQFSNCGISPSHECT